MVCQFEVTAVALEGWLKFPFLRVSSNSYVRHCLPMVQKGIPVKCFQHERRNISCQKVIPPRTQFTTQKHQVRRITCPDIPLCFERQSLKLLHTNIAMSRVCLDHQIPGSGRSVIRVCLEYHSMHFAANSSLVSDIGLASGFPKF